VARYWGQDPRTLVRYQWSESGLYRAMDVRAMDVRFPEALRTDTTQWRG